MPVPTQVSDLSTTIASNSPAGSDNVFPDLDNHIRALAGMLASVATNSATNGYSNPYLPNASAAVFNEAGADIDFRAEGDTDANLLFLDASTDRVGVGTNAPTAKLNVEGSVIINDAGVDVDVRIEGDTDANLVFVDASTDKVGIGTNAPTEKLTVNGGLQATSFNTGQLAGMRNKIINGKMEIAQRGTSFAAIANDTFPVDRFKYVSVSTTGVLTASQQTDVPSDNQFQNSLRFTVTTSDTSIAAGDLSCVLQAIEGYNIRDLIGQTFTVSFWVRSSKTGVHCLSMNNSAGDRTYVAEYTVNSANTWEKKTITVAGGLITAGTLNWTNGVGLAVAFALAAGSTFQTTANAWQTGIFRATANQVNCLDTVGNIFAITGVQLEVGSVATPFEHRPIGAELALCQRYYYRIFPNETSQILGFAQAFSSTAGGAITFFPVSMRTQPTALEQSGTASHYGALNASGGLVACSAVPTFNTATTADIAYTSFTVASGIVSGDASAFLTNNAAGYLGWSAEL